MSFTKRLSVSLSELQENVIGIVKIHGNIEMVVEENEHTFTTIWIGNLGGLSECHYPKSQFQFEVFPLKNNMKPYRNMAEFLTEPIKFHNWYNEYFN